MESVENIASEKLETKLLMVGSCSSTYGLGELIVQIPRIDEDADIKQGNAGAMAIKANVDAILGRHDPIANCYYISPLKDMVVLRFYNDSNGPAQLLEWAKHMIKAVEFVHSKGARHSDIRLDQWLLGSEMNAKLSDFNSSGYDEYPTFGLPYPESRRQRSSRPLHATISV